MEPRAMSRALVLAAALLLATMSVVRPAIAQTDGRCANSQPYLAANNTCLCNEDPSAGPTFRGSACQLVSQECGGGVFCLNSGICQQLYNSDAFQCDCPPGTKGTSCQVVVEQCAGGGFCTNGGTCDQLPNTQAASICLCPQGFVGQHCEVDAAAVGAVVCGPQVYCLNSGKCNAANTACSCQTGFTGPSCATKTVAAATTDSSSSGADSSGGSGGLSGGAIAGIVIAACVAATLASAVAVLVWRERRGRPVFVPFQDEEQAGNGRNAVNEQLGSKPLEMRRGPLHGSADQQDTAHSV